MSNNPISLHTHRKLNIATGDKVTSNEVANRKTSWPLFVKKLQQVIRTKETFQEYRLMDKNKATAVKDVGSFTAGHFKGGIRNSDNLISRELITLDADHCPVDFVDIVHKKMSDYTFVVHSTHGHCPEEPRFRLIFPLTKSIPPEQYEPIARKLAEMVGIEYFDNTTYQPARVMFWPSISCDMDYIFSENEGEWVDPDLTLKEYFDWEDQVEWPCSNRYTKRIHERKSRAEDPREKSGLIGAFCRVYDIHSAIAEFIPDSYIESSNDRYTFTGSKSANGAVVYDRGLFLYSNHESDPCSGVLCNAFDLVRLHKFGELDQDCKPQTPTNRLKSFTAMMGLIEADKSTRIEYSKEITEGFDCDPEGVEETEDLSWRALLEIGDKGKYLSILKNIRIILQNDPIRKSIFYNKLRHCFVKKSDLPWAKCEDPVNGDNWTDHDDACLRDYIESKYELRVAEKNAFDAMNVIRNDCSFHPVFDYLQSLEWDGEDRLETLLIDHLHVEDNIYTRSASKAFMCGAVARIYEPGCKFDYCLILEGGQGIGKSTFVKTLLPNADWFLDEVHSLKGKEVIESLMGQWIIELSELQAFNKSDIEHIKGFMSRTRDKARLAFDRRPTYYQRQNVFIGTTNDSQYLKDDTGNRRFWPVKCGIKRVDFKKLASVRDQIWAEAVHKYKAGEKLFFDNPEVEAFAKAEQNARYAEDEWVGVIRSWLESPQSDFFEEESERRNKVCARQIYIECLDGTNEKLSRAISNRIVRCMDRIEGWRNPGKSFRIPGYGKSRGWMRNSYEGRI